MTIGIGVLATDETISRQKPNSIVLMADTLGSYGDEFSHERLHKTFEDFSVGVYAAAADNIGRAAELFPMIATHISLIPDGTRSYGTMLGAIATATYLYKRDKFQIDIMPTLRIPPGQFDRYVPPVGFVQNVPPHIDQEVQEAWRAYRVNCDLIVGSFDKDGRAFLYTVNSSEESAEGTENSEFPGYAVIGSGSGNAQFWLCRRGHSLGMGVRRAAYHAYEAKLMAESTPTVNEHLDCIIAQHDKVWSITTHKQNEIPRGCPITFGWLRKTFARYGPRTTESLDTKRLTSRRFKG